MDTQTIKILARGAARSRTVYLGLGVTLLGFLQASLGAFTTFIKPEYMGLVNVLIGALIIVLRFFTDESLSEKGSNA